MGWNKHHKQQTRQRIISSAARLFTQKGFEHVGIDDVMREADLTRGAFYAHFASKSELYAEAILSAAISARQCVTQPLPANHTIEQVAERYLSAEHREGLLDSCPLAFLTTDIHQRDDQVRTAYTRVFEGFVKIMEQSTESLSPAAAMRMAVLMIGGLAIARALNNEELSNQLLDSCLEGVQSLVNTSLSETDPAQA